MKYDQRRSASVGSRPDIVAAQHLLRNLYDTRVLGSNVLTARFFATAGGPDNPDAADLTRQIVLETIDELREVVKPGALTLNSARHYSILMRYDVGREELGIVATSLGIRASRFYGERRVALVRLAEGLKCRKNARPTRDYVSGDAFALLGRCAAALKQGGRSDLSIELLQNLAQQAPDPAQRALVLCRLVEVYCDAGKTGNATRSLEAAYQSLNATSIAEDDLLFLRANAGYADIQIAWATGTTAEAFSIANKVRAQLRQLKNPTADEPQLLLASVLKTLGTIQTNSGILSHATANFVEALKLLDSCESAPESLRAALLSGLAYAQAITPGGMRLARETNMQALKLSREAGLWRNLASAHVNALQFEYWRGRLPFAMAHANAARAIIGVMCEPVDQSRVDLLYARIEAVSGNEHSALRRVMLARTALPSEGYLAVLSHVIESEVLMRLERHSAALNAAKRAGLAAERIHSQRGRGLASLAIAQACMAKDDLRAACEALEFSFSDLEQSGAIFPLAQAFNCSAHLTGNARHRARATELIASLQ